jgi:methionyl aminopeptidase
MVILKSLQEIEKIRAACLVVADVLDGIRELVRPGVNTQTLDEFAERYIVKAAALPAFKGYRGYPKTLCTSVNNQVVHGIPSKEVILRPGDIISIDVGAIVDGFYGDAAITLPVGEVSPEAERLIKVTEESLSRGIAQATAGTGYTIFRMPFELCGIAWLLRGPRVRRPRNRKKACEEPVELR